MTVAINKRSGAGTFAFLKSKIEWMEISDYYVGDIDSDKPVAVMAGATVVGTIVAPVVHVNGLLYGTAVSRELIVQSKGMIWSNVYTIRLQVDAGGTIQGFISNIDDAAYDSLRSLNTPSNLPPLFFDKNAPDGAPPPPTPDQLDALTRLQAEAGAALAARAELERSFDTRLTEIVGATSARATALDKEVGALRENLAAVSQELSEAQALSKTQVEQIERANHELGLTHTLLNEKTEEWEELTAVYEQLLADHEQLQSNRNRLDIALHEKTIEVDELLERTTSLETALQSSLQHSSEQEDALVRWQELSETCQERANTLESELSAVSFKLEESRRLTDMLRAQRKEAEDSWEKSEEELKQTASQLADLTLVHEKTKEEADKTRKQLTENIHRLEPLRQQVETLTKERDSLQTALQESSQLFQTLHRKEQLLRKELDETNETLEKNRIALEKFNKKQTQQLSAQTAVIMGEANKTIRSIKQRLAEATQMNTIQREQLSWHKLSLSSTQTELTQARQTIEELREAAATSSKDADKISDLQKEVERLTKILAASKQRFTSLQAKVDAKQKEVDALKGNKEKLRRVRLQLKANEKEIDRYIAESNQQGQHLADIQSTLIEREIQLQQMTETARKQVAFIKKMKQITTERIRKLQEQVNSQGGEGAK